jgi:hypothetical protein
MYVGGFERVSFFSFCPGMPCVAHEVLRNEKVLKVLDRILPLFCREIDVHEKAARSLGEYFTMEQATIWEQEANY